MPEKPSAAWSPPGYDTAEQISRMSVIELRKIKYALLLSLALAPNPRAGAVCLAVHVTGNLSPLAGFHAPLVTALLSGQLEVIGKGRQNFPPPGGPPFEPCVKRAHNSAHGTFRHLRWNFAPPDSQG
jgi:hypothetical protein